MKRNVSTLHVVTDDDVPVMPTVSAELQLALDKHPDVAASLREGLDDMAGHVDAGARATDVTAEFVRCPGPGVGLAFGGLLPSGDLFLVCLFAAVLVQPAAADLLNSLAPAVKAALVPFSYKVFPSDLLPRSSRQKPL